MPDEECLYKYVSANVGIKILESKTIRFSNPKTFNDPYDSDVPILFENKKHLDNQFFINLANEVKKLPQIKNTEYGNLDKIIERYDSSSEKVQYDPKEYIDRCFYDLKKYMRILSLSKNNDNLLMWGHYADSHKGIVIGFSKAYMFFKNAIDVIYDKNVPVVGNKIASDILMNRDDTFEAIKRAFLTKSAYWEYEQECRCMFDVKNNYEYFTSLQNSKYTQSKFMQELKLEQDYIHQPFSTKCVEKIFLGANINIDDEYKIISIIKSKYPNIKVYRSLLSQVKFKINFEEIKM